MTQCVACTGVSISTAGQLRSLCLHKERLLLTNSQAAAMSPAVLARSHRWIEPNATLVRPVSLASTEFAVAVSDRTWLAYMFDHLYIGPSGQTPNSIRYTCSRCPTDSAGTDGSCSKCPPGTGSVIVISAKPRNTNKTL